MRSVANTSYPRQKMCFIQQNTEQELETKAIRRFASLMIIAPHPNFTSTYHGVNVCLAYCLYSVLNVKALVGDHEKALVRAFSWLKAPTSALTFKTL